MGANSAWSFCALKKECSFFLEIGPGNQQHAIIESIRLFNEISHTCMFISSDNNNNLDLNPH